MNKPGQIRLAVIDDHALFRAGLISLLSKTAGIVIVGEGGNGLEAVEIVTETRPDVILLDVNMPILNGVDTVKRIKQISDCRILMLTISKRQEDLLGAIRAGADGYILKNADPEDLYRAIKLAKEGKSILSPEVTDLVIQAVRQAPTLEPNALDITPRELEVLVLLARGLTNPQISQALHISENTVKTHVRNLMEKFNATTRTEVVSKAIHQGILSSPESNLN